MSSTRKRSDSLVEHLGQLTNPRPVPPPNVPSNPPPALPPEVWSKVFSYLDDYSLWNVGHVSWQQPLFFYILFRVYLGSLNTTVIQEGIRSFFLNLIFY